jgi:membrane-associated protease RseP (regulator of RpoE activity)
VTTKNEEEKGKEQVMFRNTLFAAVAALGLLTWGATESFAQSGPRPALKPSAPQTYLRPQGLVVTQVIPGSTAAMQGIEVGDIIVSVNGSPVRSVADLQLLLSRAGGVVELQVVDVRTGWVNPILVYPRYGRIGVDVRPAPLDNVRPIPPVYPPWDRGPRPLPLPVNPGDRGMHPLPLPGPGVVPGR